MKSSVRPLLDTPGASPVDRRSFFKTLGAAATGAAALKFSSTAEARAASAAAVIESNVARASEPSALKITDLRVAVVEKAPMTCPIIRIDTNQGLVGYGEVRDGATATYALFLKSRILGENPCNVDNLFRKIKQFGGPARQAGGVCGIEMALWTWRARPTASRATRCSAATSAIACALRRHHGDRRPPGAGRSVSRRAWTSASRF